MAYSTISKPSLHFNTKLYTGNGSTQSITGVGFQPDWVWLKKRNSTADHGLYDAVRGVTKQLYSNDSAAEATNANSLTAFGTDGFSIGTSSMINGNSDTFASWNWKANGAGSSNSDGDITSTVSVNTTSGFSIVKWTANSSNKGTIGHGLGTKPKIVIYKQRTASGAWYVLYDFVDGSQDYVLLNQTTTASNLSESTYGTPTSSTISNIGFGGDDLIAYCFAEKKGYSKFGSYTGNGNADGTFVYTGFSPAFLIFKRTDTTNNWIMYDNKRNEFNVVNTQLYADSSGAEGSAGSGVGTDILSNGFKQRGTGNSYNASGGSYIFMAFAEEPLVANVGNSIPATAR